MFVQKKNKMYRYDNNSEELKYIRYYYLTGELRLHNIKIGI